MAKPVAAEPEPDPELKPVALTKPFDPAVPFPSSPKREPMKPTDFAGQILAIHRLRGERPGMKVDSQNRGFNHVVMVLGVEPEMEPNSFDVDAALAKLGYVRKEV